MSTIRKEFNLSVANKRVAPTDVWFYFHISGDFVSDENAWIDGRFVIVSVELPTDIPVGLWPYANHVVSATCRTPKHEHVGILRIVREYFLDFHING